MCGLGRILLVLFSVGTYAARTTINEVCVASCYYSLLKIRYAGANPEAEVACTNPLRVISTYYCVKLHCEENNLSPGIRWWAAACTNSTSMVNIEGYRTVVANTTELYLAGLPAVEQSQTSVFIEPAIPSVKYWNLVYHCALMHSETRHFHNAVRWIPCGFWAIVLLAGVTRKVSSLVSPILNSKASMTAPATNELDMFGILKRKAKFGLIFSPTFTYRHHQALGWFTIPTRIQSLTVLSYIILHMILSAVHYPRYDEICYSSSRAQTLRHLAERLGGLMSSSVPWLFLFGGRSNPFTILTGWGYRIFSTFHRWIAIVLVVEAVIHGVTFSAYFVNAEGWETYEGKLKNDETFLFGIMASTALGLSSAFAFAEVRKRVYELFKATHIVLAAIYLAALYEHINRNMSRSNRICVWVCIAIWGFDYLCRLARIVFMNYPLLIRDQTPAIASYSEDTGIVRLQVYTSTAKRQAFGQYYFIYFGGLRFWQCHPFSLAGCSIDTVDPSESGLQLINGERQAACLPGQFAESGGQQRKAYLTFLIRPRNGMTRILRDSMIEKESFDHCPLSVILEGPYGSAVDIRRFNDLLFIAGGSGITAVLPYIRTLLEDQRNDNTPNAKMTWVVRNEGFARDVLSNDLCLTETLPQAVRQLSLEVFVTSASAVSGVSRVSGTNGQCAPDCSFKFGRPKVISVVQGFIEGVSGPAAVFVCGPGKMADDTRSAVVKYGKTSSFTVELFDETYGW